MTTPNLPPAWAPDACTLPTADRPLRLSEFDDLFTGLTSLDRISPVQIRLHLAGAAGLEATVRNLTARETECCSFFTFTTTPVPGTADGRLTLDVEVPAAHIAVLAALAERAETLAASGKAS
ncbi:hypothetical protein Rhe02_17040 [Rhizocola hellebori]|uniref:Arsenate reductase n=1 Tax=Rhizocola hellebori TaxID=1392758 RepID=A0A8J3Q5F1_9ACTN|nr:hypothetical protein [Rhizocola hellebori]GIH03637.1 hypothetical protein Rhe02_17040 [Rhizocola hellebori]